MIFAISSTPKVWFHEALAHHQDGLVCQDRDKSAPHFHQPSYHCAFDDLVVSSPYLFVELNGAPEPPLCYRQPVSGVLPSFLSALLPYRESRGPPLI